MLLVDDNETDLCLACHWQSGSAASFTDASGDPAPHVMSSAGAPGVALPGGDYYTSNLTVGAVVGAMGHNPGTPDGVNYGVIYEDNTLGTTPPGETVGALTKWDCVSCHAPHQGDVSPIYGSATDFRLLWDQPGGFGSGVTIDAGEGDLTLNESDTNHSAYKDGLSEWCGVCHGDYHSEPAGAHYHPSDQGLPGTMVTLYNANPVAAENYSFITPVEDFTNATTNTDFVASGSAMVTCLSCHRAHAASTIATHPNYDTAPLDSTAINNTKNMTRWDMTLPSGAGMGCNKCHDKGE
jgi:nitrate reductase cytochrome c-type subunit